MAVGGEKKRYVYGDQSFEEVYSVQYYGKQFQKIFDLTDTSYENIGPWDVHRYLEP